jgi:hypothetical protein
VQRPGHSASMIRMPLSGVKTVSYACLAGARLR